MFAWRSVALVNRTRRIGPKTFEPLRKIVEDFGGCVLQYTTQLSHVFHQRHCFFVTTMFGFSSVVPQPSCAETSTYCRIYTPIPTCRIDIRRDANSHKVIQCKYLSRNLCTAVDWSSQTGLQPLRFLFLDELLPLCVGGSEDGAVFGVDFARSSLSCRKLHWSPLEHCPFPFHWLQTPCLLSIPLSHLRLVTLHLFQFSHFWCQNFVSKFLIYVFLHHRFQLLIVRHRYFSDWNSMSYNSNTVLSWSDSWNLNLYKLSRTSSVGILVIDSRISSHLVSSSWA